MKDKFIKKSNNIHGNKYDYSNVEYINAKTKVRIICPEHGGFMQTPDSHSRGVGCPKCKGGTQYTKDDFIKLSISKHGYNYDYSKIKYVNSQTKVTIICKTHGEFLQRPSEHIKGYGCRECGILRFSKTKTLTTQNFIDKCRMVHNNKYDYSDTIYINTRSKVKIICPVHGVFEQLANTHIMGGGCPACLDSKGIKILRIFLNKNNILFIPEKRFLDCKDIRSLPFDIYLPEYNLCIEYDGIQHSKSRSFFNRKKGFNDRQRKDKIKTDYCTGNDGKPNLIRFSYKNKDEEIINSLITFFHKKFDRLFIR